MKKRFMMLLLMAAVLLPLGLRAQVTIGGTSDPQAGAILDLNSTVKGGLILSNVEITDLSEIPATGFVGITSVQGANAALTGTIVYNTNENAEKKIKKGLYVWDGNDWQPVSGSTVEAADGDPTCAAIQNVILTAKSATLIIGSSGTVSLGVLSDGTNKFSGSETLKKYEWWRTDATGANYAKIAETDYNTATYAMAFNAGAGTYKAKVIAKNCAAATQTSNEITVTVTSTPPVNGNYKIVGDDCYDALVTSGTGRSDAFAGGAYVKEYSFTNTTAFSRLSFSILSDIDGLISVLPQPSTTSRESAGSVTFNVTFNSNVKTIVGAAGVKTARIGASYIDNNSEQKWAYLDIKVQDAACCPTTVSDVEGHTYTASKFGTAGCWMTQNLRSTWTLQEGTSRSITKGTNSGIANSPYYYFPNATVDTIAHPEYGLLYTWAAANVGANYTETSDAFSGIASTRQGICPSGWHLPSDYEWAMLEKEIASNPSPYADQTTAYSGAATYNFAGSTNWRPDNGTAETSWGRQMKSQTKVNSKATNGKSYTSANGGLDLLLVGLIGNGGNPYSFGDTANFWTSSASNTGAYHRYVSFEYSGVTRAVSGKSYEFSVRCKINE
ncbi:MAG: fibrobacter succinogenes major paralogous domain-containing protein [Candidatus Symbiothrix sp.]|nr:fibrobacter succinogenes major paralogous domain-containing protein [Candidatus Symbiothrix sp.]